MNQNKLPGLRQKESVLGKTNAQHCGQIGQPTMSFPNFKSGTCDTLYN